MTTTMYSKVALIAVGIYAALPCSAIAQEAVVLETFVATEYVNGGVGADSQDHMRRLGHDFPLRLEFSERKDGEFIADVPVYITDSKGNTVFSLERGGPMLDIALPNGKYKVSARFNGQMESQEVTLDGKGGKDLYFHWKRAA